MVRKQIINEEIELTLTTNTKILLAEILDKLCTIFEALREIQRMLVKK